jgi:hypothetical protein
MTTPFFRQRLSTDSDTGSSNSSCSTSSSAGIIVEVCFFQHNITYINLGHLCPPLLSKGQIQVAVYPWPLDRIGTSQVLCPAMTRGVIQESESYMFTTS